MTFNQVGVHGIGWGAQSRELIKSGLGLCYLGVSRSSRSKHLLLRSALVLNVPSLRRGRGTVWKEADFLMTPPLTVLSST